MKKIVYPESWKSMLSFLTQENSASERKIVGLNLDETSTERVFDCAGKAWGHNFGYGPPDEMERRRK
jgi:hypothetical protein